MGVSFFETMRGQAVYTDGRAQLFELEVKASSSLRHFLRTGHARLTGVVRAPPWADEAAATGSIRIRPFLGRSIDYALEFGGDDESRYSFVGHKDLNKLNPVTAMTELVGEVLHDGSVIGRATLYFDLHELGSFLRSWAPFSGRPPLPAHPSAPDRAMVTAFAAAVIRPGIHVPAVDSQTIDRTLALIEQFPPSLARAFPAALRALDLAARLRFGRSFTRLPVERATSLVDAHAHNPALHLLAVPVHVAHFHRADYLGSIGCPTWTEPLPDERPPRWMQGVTAAAELPARTELEAEVIVVGTGAGGAAAAAALAEAGVAVAIVEAGEFHGRSAHAGEPMQRMGRMYRDAGMTFSVGNTPISIPLGRTVGGTTRVNSGTCFRTPDSVLDEWADDLGLGFDRAAYHRLLDEVELELGVAPAEHRYLGPIADVVAHGAQQMGLEHGPLLRNAVGCDGQGTCMLGCPTQAKRSADVSWIPRALKANAALFTGLRVTRLLRSGRRIIGVLAQGTDADGAEHQLTIRASAVILATGALITPTLLAHNDLGNRWVGRNLSVHPGFGVQARFDQPMQPWNAIPQGYGAHDPTDPLIRYEGFWVPPQLAAIQTPLIGPELSRWMDAQAHIAHFGFMIRDRGVGRVYRGPGGRSVVRYDLERASVERLRRGTAVVSEMLIRGGAREVLVGTGDTLFVRSVGEARALATAPLRARHFNLLGAHPLGSCRIAADPSRGAADPDHRLFGTDNLYVMDGSAVPTSLGVNPQITIMATALRAARRLADRLA